MKNSNGGSFRYELCRKAFTLLHEHVGLNVAADCFMNAGMSGINGGMIIITADDPSMHSSQNEQDNRVYGNFAMIPMLEPSSQQEAYDMVYEGFELSENWVIRS